VLTLAFSRTRSWVVDYARLLAAHVNNDNERCYVPAWAHHTLPSACSRARTCAQMQRKSVGTDSQVHKLKTGRSFGILLGGARRQRPAQRGPASDQSASHSSRRTRARRVPALRARGRGERGDAQHQETTRPRQALGQGHARPPARGPPPCCAHISPAPPLCRAAVHPPPPHPVLRVPLPLSPMLECIIARVQPIVSSTCTRRSFGSCLAFGGPGQDVAPFVNGSPPGPLPRFQRSGADKTLLAPCQSTPGAFHTRPVRMFSRWSCRLAGSKEVDVEV